VTPATRIRNVLKEFGEDFDDSNVWKVQGTPVLSHKTLERIAAKAKIRFDLPTIIRAERDEAVIMVAGRRGDQQEWSIGECLVNVNYRVSGKQAAYVWAMAEKRAKDRVILKLVELHGFAYSEDEADDLKTGPRQPMQADEPEGPDSRTIYLDHCRKVISEATDPQTLRQWLSSDDAKQARRDFSLTQDEVDSLKTAFGDRLQQLAPRAVG
jgi:hypothetical protein